MSEEHRLGIGGNEPPADPFLANLEEAHRPLSAAMVDLEMETLTLPATVESDDDMAAITAWVVKARAKYREIEAGRIEAGQPILAMTRTINAFFSGMKENLAARAKEIENRNLPYVKAKQARIEAEAAAAADRARKEREEAAEVERKAREAREEAQRKEREAQDAIRKAAEENDAKALAAAEAEARAAGAQITQASLDVEAAATAQVEAAKGEDRHLSVAQGGHALQKTGAGGNVRVETVWSARIEDEGALIDSMGPIGRYISANAIVDALARCAREVVRPTIPGVVYESQDAAKTTATKKRKV